MALSKEHGMTKIVIAGRAFWSVSGVVYTTLADALEALHGSR